MEIRIEITDRDIQDLVCQNLQTVLLRLAGSLYRAPLSVSGQIPQFRIIEQSLDLGQPYGCLGILAADHKNSSLLINVAKGEIGIPDIVRLLQVAALLRSQLMTSLQVRLGSIQDQNRSQGATASSLFTSFEDEMKDRGTTALIYPVVIGARFTNEALLLMYGLNSQVAKAPMISHSAPGMIFAGTYHLSIELTGNTVETPQVQFEVKDALSTATYSVGSPQTPGREILKTYADETGDRLIREFLDYEQQKRAHKSGMFRAYQE